MGDRIRKAICGPGYCFASLVCAKTGKKYATPIATSRLQRCFGSHAGIPNTKALYMQTFRPPHLKEEGVKGVVFLVHDYGDHSSWFLRDLAVALCQQEFLVVSLDLEGHGRSDGLRGRFDFGHAVIDLCDQYGAFSLEQQSTPCFLLGEGLGAALAYKTYQMQGGRFWDGIILLSPTLAFPPRLRPSPWMLRLLRRLEPRMGDLPLIPWGRQYLDLLSDSVARQEVMENPFFIQHGMRVATIFQVLAALDELYLHPPPSFTPASLGPSPPSSGVPPRTSPPSPAVCTFNEMTAPFLILQGEEDRFHGGRERGGEGGGGAGLVVRELHRQAKSLDKTLKFLPGLSHCLLGEGRGEGGRERGLQQVSMEVLGWLNARCSKIVGGGQGGTVGGGEGGSDGGEMEEEDSLELVHRP